MLHRDGYAGEPDPFGGIEEGQEIPDEMWQTWTWPGIDNRFHYVPPGYRLPPGTVKEIWDLYWFGDKYQKIRPFRKLDAKFEFTISSDKVKLSKVKRLMHSLYEDAKDLGLVPQEGQGSAGLSVYHSRKSISDEIFDATYSFVLERLYPTDSVEKKKRRVDDLSYSTVQEKYRRFMKNMDTE